MNAKLAGVDKMIGAHPESYWKTPLFTRKDGRPVFPIGGGAPADDDDDDADDADDDDAGDDDDLDAEIDDATGGDDDADDDTDLTDAEKKLAKRLEKTLQTQLAAATQSIADRLVNAQNTAAKKAARARAAAAANGGGGKGGKPAEETKAVDHGPDIRDARATYRELVAGEITFASNVEREAGMKLAAAIIAQEVPKGADPDDAGKAAAQQVAATIQAIRKDARKNLLIQLKKEGRLVKREDGAGAGTGGGIGGQPNRGGTGVGAKTEFEKGAAQAARLRPRAGASQTK